MSEDLMMQEIGRRGGLKTSERHGREHFSAAGRKGGMAKLQKYGPEHFEEMRRKSLERRRELIALGWAALEAEEG